jgi:hypothetical protein
MKLVQILAKGLEKWPRADFVVQEFDGELYMARKVKPKNNEGRDPVWYSQTGGDGEYFSPSVFLDLASDCATAIVNREMWQAARAKLKPAAKAKAKAKGDGWIRHRGGNSPVKNYQAIEYRMRSGQVMKTATGGLLNWRHGKWQSDIMAYRIIKPSEQSPDEKVMQDCVEKCASTESVEIQNAHCEETNPVAWRNLVFELDARRAEVDELYQRQSAEIAQERESLISKLAAEGFALIERVSAPAQPAEDMSDPKSWIEGDLLLCEGAQTSHYTNGRLYSFIRISNYGSARCIDDRGTENGLLPQFFKWHSRPAK